MCTLSPFCSRAVRRNAPLPRFLPEGRDLKRKTQPELSPQTKRDQWELANNDGCRVEAEIAPVVSQLNNISSSEEVRGVMPRAFCAYSNLCSLCPELTGGDDSLKIDISIGSESCGDMFLSI